MAFGNSLLDRLDAASSAALFADLELVDYGLLDRLDDEGDISHVVFPASVVVSLLTRSEEGGPIELVTVGNEGFIGTPVLLGAERFLPGEFAQCQVPGSAWRLRRERFEGLLHDEPPVWALMAKYVQAYQSLLSRQVLCNLLHGVDQRVARWLLVTGDRAGSTEFPLTQDFLSEMLGVRRASVNVAERRLQADGLIEYGRGRMRLLDRPGLEGLSCRCYAVMRDRFDELLA